ncbi:MAG TPA: helix-turn-helix transcriptional regulator [Abditibacteriaceae bacterium]|jgi:transcriptional regulator with XRE-family HTH domain
MAKQEITAEQKRIGDYLAHIRVNAGLTQKEASERAGMGTPVSLSLLERGVRSPSYKTLVKLSNVYPVPLEEMCEAVGINVPAERVLAVRHRPSMGTITATDHNADLLDAAMEFIKRDRTFQMPPFLPETPREKALVVSMYQQLHPRILMTDEELKNLLEIM